MSDNRKPSQNPTEGRTTAVVQAVTTKDFATTALKFEEQFSRLIPSAIKRSDILSGKRIVGLLVNAFSTNEDLRQCKPSSILNAAGLACAVGLEFNNALGQSAIIPYKKGSGPMNAQWQMMYRGGITLAMRSGKVANCYAAVVLDQDEFEYEYGTNEFLRHRPATRYQNDFDLNRDWTKTYFYAKYASGGYTFHVMDRADVELIKKQSSQFGGSDYSPWNIPAFQSEMIRKTPTKQHLKFMDLTPHLSMAVGLDDQADAGSEQDQVIEWKDYSSDDVDHPNRRAQAQGTGPGQQQRGQRPESTQQSRQQQPSGEESQQQRQSGGEESKSGQAPFAPDPEDGSLFGKGNANAETGESTGPFVEADFTPDEFTAMLTAFKSAGYGSTKAQLLAMMGRSKVTKAEFLKTFEPKE